MDSRLDAVPLSTTMAYFSDSTISAGIRAPLTMDESDFECSVSSSKSQSYTIGSSYNSNSELESEGFMSGEDESETRPYMTGEDEDILEETRLFHEYGNSFFRPFVRNPAENFAQESRIVDGNSFFRPFVRDPNENFPQESGNFNGNSFFRPFVRNPDENYAQESGNVHGNSFFRPFVRNPDGNVSQESGNVNGHSFFRPFVRNTVENSAQESGNVHGNSFFRPFVRNLDENVSQESGNVHGNSFFRPFVRNPDENVSQESGNVNGPSFFRPFVRNPDENSAQESGNVHGNSFFRPFVRNPDENVSQESNVNGNSFFRPSVRNPGENSAQESGNVHGNSFFRPFVRNPDENVSQESGNVNGNSFFRPYLRNPVEDFAQESGNANESSFFRSFVGNPYVKTRKVISKVDDSDDSGSFLSESDHTLVENENYGSDNSGSRLLGAIIDEENLENGQTQVVDIIKVPVVQKLHIPIAMISRDSDDDGSQGSEVFEDEDFLDSRVPSFEVLRRVNSVPRVRILEVDEGYDDDLQAEKMVEMEFVKDLVISNDGLDTKDENEHNDVGAIIKCVITSDTVEDKANSLAVNVEYNSISEFGQNRDSFVHLDEEIQEFDVTDDRVKCVDLVVDLVDCSNTGLDDNFTLNQNVESEKLETDNELDPVQKTVESFSFIGTQTISSLYQHIDANDMSGGYMEGASLTGNEAWQSFYNIAQFDQETTKEDEKNEELLNEVKNSIFHDGANTMLAKTERGQDSITPSNENILHEIHCQAVTDSEGRASDCVQIVDPAASFNAVKVVVSDDGAAKPEVVDGAQIFSVERTSADLGYAFGSTRHNIEEITPEEALSEREKTKNLERLQQVRVKYSLFLQRLSRFPEDFILSEDLCQLSLAEAKPSTTAFSLDSARKAALELEAREKCDLDFSVCILVIGKSGVGKSATINSIFGENKTRVNAFEPSTIRVKEVNGEINGVKVRIFDTPGLSTYPVDRKFNQKILSSIKKLMRKSPPDVILYVERLDAQFINLDDLPLLKSVTFCLGSSIWQKSIIAFTHANLLLPDGPDGYPSSYEEFIDQQSRAIQQLISQSCGEMNSDLIIPVSLLENHPFAKTNQNQERWRSKLLFLCYSMKILSEVSSVVKIDNHMDNLKGFFRQCFLEPSCRILTRSFFDSYRDFDYDGVLIEDYNLEIGNPLAAIFSIQPKKDKRYLKINVSARLNTKLGGRISVKTGGLDQLQIAALALFPIAKAAFYRIFGQSAED